MGLIINGGNAAITSAHWHQVKGNNNTWTMDYTVADNLPIYTVAQYPRFKRSIDMNPNSKISMAWNSANGVWEWEIDGWNWPWEDESETPNEGAEYGTGVSRDVGLDGSNRTCTHEWVNISFHHLQLACKHCGIDKPE